METVFKDETTVSTEALTVPEALTTETCYKKDFTAFIEQTGRPYWTSDTNLTAA